MSALKATINVGLLLLCTASCGPPQGGALPAEELRTRMLRYQRNHLHQRQFYVGIAQAAELQTATSQAYQAITRQLTWLPDGSRQLLQGLYRVDRSAKDKSGVVHVLAVLERVAAAGHLRRLRDERRGQLRTALAGCRKKLDTGDLPGARACHGQLLRLVGNVRGLHVASRSAVGDGATAAPLAEEGQVKALGGRIGSAEAMGKSVLVKVLKEVDGRPAGDLNPAFQAIIAGGGLKLASGAVSANEVKQALGGNTRVLARTGQSAGAGFVLAGSVESAFSGSEMGQFFARATGRLKVVETQSGRTVLELSVGQTKGGHIARRPACDKAVSHVVKKLTADLKTWVASRGRDR